MPMTNDTKTDAFPRDFVLALTDEAAAQVRRAVAEHGLPDTAGLRVGATEGGCSGLNYDVAIAERPGRDDRVLEINGTRVFVNGFSAPHVNGMTVDWVSSMQESRFVFQNPNATGTCGCGVSFSVS